MARGPVQIGALGSKVAQQAARAEAVAKVTEALAEGPKTMAELLEVVKCLRPTMANYMRYMHKTLRVIHMTGQYRNRGELWALGADTTLPTFDEQLDQLFAAKCGTVPARQLGMWRDPLVAALFGPASGGAAC
jgi:hypothetical protein